MIIDAYVTRPILGGGVLSLWDENYKLEGEEGIQFGQRTWNRKMVGSPFVHGEFPVTQVLANSTLNLVVQVQGASQADLASKIAALVAAFSQFEYEFYIEFDSHEWAWTCWAADIGVGSMDERMDQHNVAVTLAVPRAPHQIADGGI